MSDLSDRLQSALGTGYAVTQELGGGGMSRVFLAEERSLGRKIVVKVLPPDLAADVNADRFRREIQLAAQLQHPHIVPLLSAGQAEGLLYFTMPLIAGESLRAKIAREGALPVTETVRILRDVVDALGHAHERGIVHRDVKPDNILISGHHAVVADFGVAKALTAAAEGSSLTSTGLALGTAAYMAPEQASADPQLDHRADLYAVGAVAYEMLTGQAPFRGTAQQVMARQVAEAPEPVDKIRPSIPASLAMIVMRCLEKYPADRFQTAEELLHELELIATPTSSTAPFTATVSESRLGAPALRASRTPRVLSDDRRRTSRWMLGGAGLAVTIAVLIAVLRPWARAPANVRSAGGAAAAPVEAASVAVLPFDNVGGKEEDAYFSEGITEEIIGQLAQVEGLKVISRTSVVALKASNLTLPQIADTLQVENVLEGSVRRLGNRVRVTVQLIEAKTDAHLWADSYDRDLTDVFSVQEEIARQVSARLVSSFRGLRPSGVASRTEQTAAYDAYLKGTYWRQRRTEDGLRRAIEAFEEAIKLDSAYAPAYAGLSAAYTHWVGYRYTAGLEPYSALARARHWADRAIALDPTLAEAYAARGYASVWTQLPTDSVLPDFQRALQLRPNSGEVHGWHAMALSFLGRHTDALAEAQTSITLDPLAPGLRWGYSGSALPAGRYDIALREVRRARVLEPALKVPSAREAILLLLLGRAGECVNLDVADLAAIKAMCLHAVGRLDESANLIDSLSRSFASGERTADVAASLAIYYAWEGNAPASLQWLERAFALAPNGVDVRVVQSAVFDRVRDDPDFRTGLERILERVTQRVREGVVKLHAR